MRRGLGTAAAIVMNTKEAAKAVLLEFPELANRPIVAIPNGYDAADFADPEPGLDPDVFRIAHTGSFHTTAGLRRRTMVARRTLGGSIGNVDFLTRSTSFSSTLWKGCAARTRRSPAGSASTSQA